jgi:5'-nucleotidase
MHFLLTNDDGIEAPGLWAAAGALASLGTVLVVAPVKNYSGYGAALPAATEISFWPYQRAGLAIAGVTAFGVSGTPATCAHVGLSGALSKRPVDLVVSGINDSANLGRDVFYSGTVGAALTAHLAGVPAIAISLDAAPSGVPHWETAAWAVEELVRTWQVRQTASPALFNVNVPNRPLSEVAGVQMTALGGTSFLLTSAVRATSDNTLAVISPDGPAFRPTEPGSDGWALNRGYVSITPLRVPHDLLYSGLSAVETGEPIPVTLPRLAAVGL